jgi:hypothetical protein
VYAGPLSGGDYVFGLLNRGSQTVAIQANFSMLEVQGFGDSTTACVEELFSGVKVAGGVTGGMTWNVASHDIAVVRVRPGASDC